MDLLVISSACRRLNEHICVHRCSSVVPALVLIA
jgi:hypothetical protein